MSLFSWFKSPPETPHGPAAGAHAPAASPRETTHKHGAAPGGEKADDTEAGRKHERARLRELLYNVVRESMVREGVLSSGFKFKVLATDPRARKFIVMMDLSKDFGSEISQLADIETLICQSALARYNIVVSSVYWRAEEPAAARKPAPEPAPAPAAHKPKPEPVLDEEISALKRALASGAAPAAAVASATGRKARNDALLTGFENTEFIDSRPPTQGVDADNDAPETMILDEETRLPALSPTQYGDLR